MPTRLSLPVNPYPRHVAKWQNCTRCELHQSRRTVVIGRGELPAETLWVGEAPGDTEDLTGQPFSGPAGDILNEIIDKAFAIRPQTTYAITNVVACIPRDAGTGLKDGQPSEESIVACTPRLIEFARMASPRLLVRVGKLAETWVDSSYMGGIDLGLGELPTVDILHPAFIARKPWDSRTLLIQQQAVRIAKAVERVFGVTRKGSGTMERGGTNADSDP